MLLSLVGIACRAPGPRRRDGDSSVGAWGDRMALAPAIQRRDSRSTWQKTAACVALLGLSASGSAGAVVTSPALPAPCERLSMRRSASIQDPDTAFQLAFDIKANPEDSNEFMVAGTPHILRLRRFGGQPAPNKYHKASAAFPDTCVAIMFCPCQADCFVAGFQSGTVCLFSAQASEPIHSWFFVCEDGVKALTWSTFRPSVFFVLDGKGTLHMWDLLENDQGPSQQMNVGSNESGLLDLSHATNKDNDTSMLAIKSSERPGAVGLHLLKPALGKPRENEKNSVLELLLHLH